MKLPWQKTSQQEVFDYIVKYEKMMYENLGRKGIYPKPGFIAGTFDITPSNASRYLKKFQEKVKQLTK